MNKSTYVLITVLLALLAAYAYWFTDWFTKPTIQILAQIRPTRLRAPVPGTIPTYPVSFAFDRKVELTEVAVFTVDDVKSNKYPHALWHLVSDSNSIPTKALLYGQAVRGMHSKTPLAKPERLDPDVKYRLLVKAGRAVGTKDFKTIEAPESMLH